MAGARRVPLRWIVGTVLVAAIVGGCLAAGFWQLRRLDERRALNERIRERSEEAVPLPAVDDRTDPDDLAYRRVAVTGTYDPAGEVLVRFRIRNGLPGYEVLTPLRTDGATILVDRGWVPLTEGDRWPEPDMAPPAGEVEVAGLLAPPESGDIRLERRPDGVPVVAAVDPARLADELGAGELYPAFLLADDGGTPASSYPVPIDPPPLDDGPHRSYAVQWFLFAGIGVVAWPLLVLRRGPLRRRSATPDEAQEPAPAER